MAYKPNNHDKYRANAAAAKRGGPDYRATATGKGDVNRSRDKTQLDLGFDLMTASEEFGIDSPEYNALLKQWEDGKRPS